LRVEVVTDLSDLVALTDRWTALVHTSPHATAYASPAYILTWYRHFERPGGIYAITIWHHDQLVGLAPFARTRIGHPPAAITLLVSAGTEHGDYGEPLLGPDPTPVADAITDHLATLVNRHHTTVNLRRLRDDGPLLTTIETRDDIARTPMGQIADAAVIRLDQLDDPTTHLKRLASKHSIPRRMRRLAETHGDITYQPDDPDHTRALDTMRDMLERRWGPDDGPPMFRTPHMDAFTRDTLRNLTDTGFARIATLTAGTTPVAVSTVLQVDDRLISDNAALDPDLGTFGPGHAELYHLVDHAHSSGATEVDLRAGDFPYKYKWANTTHRTRSIALTTPGIKHDAMHTARRALMSLRARRLNHLRDAVSDDRRRRWLLAIALVVGIAAGDTTSTSTVVSELAMADLATAA
jgi:CelD/BcsL family acetyltransferase involved in cellulose biosynthesis